MITDKATGTLVVVIVSLDGKIIAEDVAEIKVWLPGHLADRPVTVTVEPLGCGEWETGGRWNVKNSRTFRVTVNLHKV